MRHLFARNFDIALAWCGGMLANLTTYMVASAESIEVWSRIAATWAGILLTLVSLVAVVWRTWLRKR